MTRAEAPSATSKPASHSSTAHHGSKATLEPEYKIPEQPIGTRRPIRVACMGAGYSGLMMAIVFSERMQERNAELVIYERNGDLGGTWLENRFVSFFIYPLTVLIDFLFLLFC